MSNYTITTNFGAKDSLPSTDAGKVIKGSEFTTEFTNIQTAIATKADTAGDTFTGAVTFDAAVTLNADVTFDTNTLFIDVSANKVGIGNTSPAYELDVTGSAQLSGGDLILRGDSTDADTQSIRFENASSDDRSAYIRADYSTNSSGNATSLVFGTNPSTGDGSDRMVIDNTGNVGIGETNPDAELHISAAFPKILMQDTDGTNQYGEFYHSNGTTAISARNNATNGSISFQRYDGTTATTSMRIDTSGNVGIGYTSPDSKLDVAGVIKGGDVAATGGGTALSVKYTTGHTLNNFGATFSSAETLIGFGVESHKSQANKFISTASNASFTRGALTLDNELKFFNAAATSASVGSEVTMTERMRIDSSGNLLVGTTSATAMGTTNTGVVLRDNDSSYFARNSNGTIIAFFSGLGGAGSISLTGNTANYNTTSDERLKENITDSADAGSKVDAIQIRQFDWKADGSHQDYGVIAQELINVAPEAVSEGDTEEDMMGVDYSKLVPLLIKEVQALRSRVAELENK